MTTRDHNPLTCKDCDPTPWAQLEVAGRHGRRRRFTGWAALAVVFGPVLVLMFAVGVLVGLVIAR